jgi:hypothetical protein
MWRGWPTVITRLTSLVRLTRWSVYNISASERICKNLIDRQLSWLASIDTILWAATNGTLSTAIKTSRVNTEEVCLRFKILYSSAHGRASISRISVKVTFPSAPRCSVSDPQRVSQNVCDARRPAMGIECHRLSVAVKPRHMRRSFILTLDRSRRPIHLCWGK